MGRSFGLMRISSFEMYLLKRKRFLYYLFIYFSLFLSGIGSAGLKNYRDINIHVDKCILDSRNCKEAFVLIHSYQEAAASSNNYPCQTRLLGLEANLIMAMNNNLKKKKLYDATNSVEKYC